MGKNGLQGPGKGGGQANAIMDYAGFPGKLARYYLAFQEGTFHSTLYSVGDLSLFMGRLSLVAGQ